MIILATVTSDTSTEPDGPGVGADCPSALRAGWLRAVGRPTHHVRIRDVRLNLWAGRRLLRTAAALHQARPMLRALSRHRLDESELEDPCAVALVNGPVALLVLHSLEQLALRRETRTSKSE